MSAPTIEQIVAQIRTALYGKDVRENIALGIETCFDILENNVASVEDTKGYLEIT